MKTEVSDTREWYKLVGANITDSVRNIQFNWKRSGIVLFCTLLSISILFGGKTSPRQDLRKKSDFFFLKGAIKEAEGEIDAAYEYYKKAYAIYPDNPDAAFTFGSARAQINNDTLISPEEKAASLMIARKMIDRYPGDMGSVINYSYMALMADSAAEAVRALEALEKYHPSRSYIQAYKANAYAAMGNTDSAISAIKRFERLEGMGFETTLQKVRFHLMKNDTLGAIGELDELIANNPKSAEYIAYKAKVFDMLAMPDSAMVYFNEALKLDPDDGYIKNDLALLYAQRGDSATYDNLIKEALLSDNLAFETKMQILAKYLQRMVNDKADTKRSDLIFQHIAEQYPHEPQMLDIGARYSAAKKDYKEALRQIDYAMDLDPQNPEYLEPKMSYFILDDHPEGAMKAYEEARRNGMQTVVSNSMLYITAAQQAEKYDPALNTLDSLINLLTPGLSLADTTISMNKLRSLEFIQLYLLSNYYQIAGDIFYAKNQLPDAFRSYQNSLDIFPENALSLNNYAYFLIEKGGFGPGTPEFEKAKEMSAKSLDYSTNPNPTYLDTYAWILFKEKNYTEAEKYQSEAVEIEGEDGSDPDLYSHYGDILFMNGKPEEALKYWEKALKLDPDNPLLKKKVSHKTFFFN